MTEPLVKSETAVSDAVDPKPLGELASLGGHALIGQHAGYHQEAIMMPANPFAVPVVLFGWGEWSRQKWFPVLVQLARWGIIKLTVVDQWARQAVPAELSALEEERVLEYSPWDCCFESASRPEWKVAFVITSASAHAQVIHQLLERAPNLNTIVCEKPCGESLQQAQELFHACQRRSVTLLVADHYLLRPPVQHLLVDPQPLQAIGELIEVRAALNESKTTGPAQGVIADLMIHLLDILLALFPGAQIVPDTASIARAEQNAHIEDETYAVAVGNLFVPNRSPAPCYLECGKQLAEDRKEVTIIGEKAKLHLDLIDNTLSLTTNHKSSKEVHLKWNPTWSYARLILNCLSLSS
jgi:predicted dehydrogenase